MRRRVLAIIFALVLGALLNFAITWLLVYSGLALADDRLVLDARKEEIDWPRPVPVEWGPKARMVEEHFHSWARDSIPFEPLDATLAARPPSAERPLGLLVQGFGFPARSLSSWSLVWFRPNSNSDRIEEVGQIVISRHAALPCVPIWPGFAINTLLHAAIAWLLWRSPAAVRRSVRRRSGRCVRCGYSLAGLAGAPICPECGPRRANPARSAA